MGQLSHAAKGLKVGDILRIAPREITLERMVEFERVVWDRGRNSHNDPLSAQRDGLSKVVASGQNQMAFLHELLEHHFGDAWVFGGTISVRYIHPVYAGDRLAPAARVAAVEDIDGKPTARLEVWCENQDGTKTAAGTATAGLPVAARSWIPMMGGA